MCASTGAFIQNQENNSGQSSRSHLVPIPTLEQGALLLFDGPLTCYKWKYFFIKSYVGGNVKNGACAGNLRLTARNKMEANYQRMAHSNSNSHAEH